MNPDCNGQRFRQRLANTFKYYRYSMTTKLTLVLLFVFPCTMIVIGYYFYGVISEILTQKVVNDLAQLVREANLQIELQLNTADDAAIFVISNPDIRSELVKAGSKDSLLDVTQRKLAIERQMDRSLYYNYSKQSLIESAYIFSKQNEYYYINAFFRPNSYEEHLEICNRFEQNDALMTLYPPELDDSIIYLVRDIKENRTNESLGTLVLGLNGKRLQDVYSNILGYLYAQVYLFDSYGGLLIDAGSDTPDRNEIAQMLEASETETIQPLRYNGQNYYTTVHFIDRFKGKAVVMIPEKEITASLNASLRVYGIVIIIGFIMVFFIGMALSSSIKRPVKSMIANINQFKGGDFSVKMPAYREYEFNELSQVFNKMTNEIQELFKTIYEKQLLIKESELKQLQSQINPHFLLNVLDAISWEARLSQNEKIYEMITSLGQMMAATLTFSNQETITIKKELEYIEFYLFLQKMRFGDKLHITINMGDEMIADWYIPKFCLYTVVENAIVHGLEEKTGERILMVGAHIAEDHLVFSVEDNGIGFDTSRVNLNAQETVKDAKNKHTHIGLYNANRRIQLLYGTEYGINLQSEEERGTKVSIRLPVDRGENHI